MPFDPLTHHRRSIRLRGYDYAQPGAYFVTLCVQQHECVFGRIISDEMVLNDVGEMAALWWEELPRKFPSCETDAFVVMLNHLHGLVVIRDDSSTGVHSAGGHERGGHAGPPLRIGDRPTLGRIVRWFKTMTTNAYIRGVDEHGWERFNGRLWQRNYYEHIIRDPDDLSRVREYIENNPRAWEHDPENPATKRRTER